MNPRENGDTVVGMEHRASINIVPLIGVLAAILAVLMVGMVPNRTARFVDGNGWGCRLCFGGPCENVRQVRLHVRESGLVTLAGHDLPASGLSAVIRLTPEAPKFDEVFVDVSADSNAEYADTMRVLSELKKLGLSDEQIFINTSSH